MAVASWVLATDSIAYDMHVKRYVSVAATDGGAFGTLPYMTGGDSTPWLALPQASVVRWSVLANQDWGVSHRNPATAVSSYLTGAVAAGSTATTINSTTILAARAWSGGNYGLKITSGALSGQVARILNHASGAAGNSIVVEAPGFSAAPAAAVTYEIVPINTIGSMPNVFVYTSNANILSPQDSGHLVANPAASYNPLATPSILQFAWSATGEMLVPNSYIAFAIDGPAFEPEGPNGLLSTITVTIQNRGSI